MGGWKRCRPVQTGLECLPANAVPAARLSVWAAASLVSSVLRRHQSENVNPGGGAYGAQACLRPNNALATQVMDPAELPQEE
ncbi:MAG: hypothetical protein NTW87_03090 [Planctomycetota bacterium]|nr:hypothetical protein [Planctomycetota bacterium]